MLPMSGSVRAAACLMSGLSKLRGWNMEYIGMEALGPSCASVVPCLHLTDGCSPAPASDNILVYMFRT